MDIKKVFQNNQHFVQDKLAIDKDYFENLGK